jgi:hypothetical protein
VTGLRTSTLRAGLAAGLALALGPAATAGAQSMTMPEVPTSEAISGQYQQVSAMVETVVTETTEAIPGELASAAREAAPSAVTSRDVTPTESDTTQYQTPESVISVSEIAAGAAAPATRAIEAASGARDPAPAPRRARPGRRAGTRSPAREAGTRHALARKPRAARGPRSSAAETVASSAPAPAVVAAAPSSPAPSALPAISAAAPRLRAARANGRRHGAARDRRPARGRTKPARDDGGPAPPTPSAPGAAPGGAASAGSGSGFGLWAAVLLAAPALFVPSLRRRFRSGPGRRPPGPLVVRLERPG